MKKNGFILALVFLLALFPTSILAANNNSTQKGSYTVLLEPDVRGNTASYVYGNVALKWTGDTCAIWEYTNSGLQKISDDYFKNYGGLSSSGYACVRDLNKKYGIINYQGKTVIEFGQYDWLSQPSDDGYVTAQKDSNTYIINLNTSDATKIEHRAALIDKNSLNNGLLAAKKSDYYYYVDALGNIALPGPYSYYSEFSNGYAMVNNTGDLGHSIIDTFGAVVLSDDLSGCKLTGGALVSKEGLVSVHKASGYISPSNNGYLFGYVNLSGDLVIPCEYDSVRDFVNGYAVVWKNDKCGLIDTTGNTVIPIVYDNLTNVSDTGLVWATKERGGWMSSANFLVAILRVEDYIYDSIIPGENITLNIKQLNEVTDQISAVTAVKNQTSAMTDEQKSDALSVDLATLYAETTVSKAAKKEVSGSKIIINAAAVTELQSIAVQTRTAVESALVSGGVSTARYLANTVTLVTQELGEISIKIDPDILTTEVDKIRVETPVYAVTLKVEDLKADLTEILTITTQNVGTGFAPGSTNKKVTISINLPKGRTTNPVTISLPSDSGSTTYQAIVNASGTPTASKYNPATATMDGKVNTSGIYTVKENSKDFSDITNKSAEMQKAIRYLASKGIISGTSSTTFSPDQSISRAEIATLIVQALGKLDSSAKTDFTDVKTGDWYYRMAASSKKAGLIAGFEDNTFRGNDTILKEQIVTVAGRVLVTEMGYKEPGNVSGYLSKYKDTVVQWAQPMVSLATRENLVVYRTDGTFSGEKAMTRGDAAIIVYRMFQRIW